MAGHKKRFKRGGDSVRGNLGIAISLVALLISGFAVIHPILAEKASHEDVERRYLDALVGSERSAYVARGMAAEGSQADQFAQTIGVLWEAVVDSGADLEALEGGKVTGTTDGFYEVCFPQLAAFRSDCDSYGDFEFTEQNRVSRFTIDGQPVEQLFKSSDYGKTLTSADGSSQMRAYSAGRMWDSDSKEKVILLWVDRGAATSSAGRDDLTLSKVTAQDGQAAEVPVIAAYFPDSFSFYDAYYAAVRVPTDARFLSVCWDGVPAEEESCDWIFSIR